MPSQLTKAQIKARRLLAEARAKKRGRKRDTRCKVVAGAVVLAHARRDDEFRRLLRPLLQDKLKPEDRALFADLLFDA